MSDQYSTLHNVEYRNRTYTVRVHWHYYPGSPQTYHEPEEPEYIEYFQIDMEGIPEFHRKGVKDLLLEKNYPALEKEALKQIHQIFISWRESGYEYV